MHATSPFGPGARALRDARTLGVPSVAVHDTDVPAHPARRARTGRAGRARAAGCTWTALTGKLVAHDDVVRSGTMAAA